jgi:nucleoside-diphosphate-sugar epimerase
MKVNNKKSIIITGSRGCVGSILQDGLSNVFNLYFLDLKEKNTQKTFNIDIAKEYKRLVKIFKNKDIIIHLAWDFTEDFPRETIILQNKLMAENVYSAAVEAGVKRVIIASSVHANDYSTIKNKKDFISKNPWPDSPYGASKIYIESLGRYYAKYHALEIICIRFGGINRENNIIYKEDPNYDKVLLFKNDCINLIKSCILVKKVPNNFQVFTAVSNNKNRVHSIKNFLGWRPKFPQQ